jgi:RNA polymerase sigma factor (sigma-70 family)
LAFIRNISSSAASDEELVSQFKATGDLSVLGALYQRYMDLVYGVCLKYLRIPENAQDSTIAIFEELVVKLKKHEVEHFRAWLYSLAKNHCLMRIRSEKKSVTVAFDVELMQSEENLHLNGELDREENFRKLDHCMEKLDPDQKTVIELFYLQGKCYKEVSEITGMEWNKVRSFIQNGRRNLKICMDNQKAKAGIENDAVFKK